MTLTGTVVREIGWARAGETLYQPKMAYAIVTYVHEHKTMAIYMEDLTLGAVL